MSHKQDHPRLSFYCGNLFKNLLPKNNKIAGLSPKLLSLLNNFETNLTVSIRELIPKDKNDVLTVSWMRLAMESLCKTHMSIRTLVMDLELPMSDLEDYMIHLYSDISLKLLELCNAFTSELNRLNHGNLLLKFALNKLEANNCQTELPLSHLDNWKQHMVFKNPRIENCTAVLSSLVDSMNLTEKAKKKKHSAKGKVLVRALYGVKIKTFYTSSVFAAAFSGFSRNLFYLTVPKEMEELPWAQAFMELQNTINPEIKNTLLSDRITAIKDVEAVESGVKKVYTAGEEESVKNLVETLKKSVMELSESLDLLSKETNSLLKIVISGRDGVLESLWKKYAEDLGMKLPMMIKSVETCVSEEKHVSVVKVRK